MARTPARVSERRMITRGSVWTDGSNDVQVYDIQDFGEYRYITYVIVGTDVKSQPVDDHTFALRFTAKVVRKDDVKTLVSTPQQSDAGKVKMAGWV